MRRMDTSNGVCNAVEMADVADETEMDEDTLLSDQDSVSLLQDLPALQSDSASTEVQSETEPNRQKGTQPKSSGGERSAAGCAAASSSRSAKVPNEKFLHKRNKKGETLLHKACQKGDLAQVRVLLQAGIGVNVEDYAGWTALHEACVAGDESVVEELLRAGADVNARSCDGETPLHDAVRAGHHQVVKLLLEKGSNPTDQNVGGLSALHMAAEDSNMRELLVTFRTPSDGEGTARRGEPGSEDPGETGDGGGEATDVRLRPDGRTNNTNEMQISSVVDSSKKSRSDAVSAVLEDVGRKQADMSAWLLTDLRDVGRCNGALLQTQSALMDVLAKQRLEKDDLTHKFRVAPEHLRQRVLKSHFLSLASTQKNLSKLLQKQMQLEEACVTAKAKICAGAPSCRQDTVLSERHRPAAQKQSKDKGAPTFPELQSEKASSRRTAPRPKTASRIYSKTKGKNVVVQRRAKDDSGGLCRLVQVGVLPQGSALHLTLKGKHHVAHVQSNGCIISKGKVYRAPVCWLECILGHNIPVSSTYALDKVTFRNKPLSYFFLNLEAKQNPSEIQLQDEVRYKDDCTHQEPSPEPANPYRLLQKIKMIHLVNSEELLPNAIMDFYWEKLLKQNHGDFDDWESEL